MIEIAKLVKSIKRFGGSGIYFVSDSLFKVGGVVWVISQNLTIFLQ